MLSCKDISGLATDYREGDLSEGDRAQFESHVATCAGCATWVQQLDATARILGSLPPPELPVDVRERLLARFDGWARPGALADTAVAATARARGSGSLVAAFAALGAMALLVAMAKHPSGENLDWRIALVLAAVATGLGTFGRRVGPGLASAAVAAPVAAAFLRGGAGPLGAATGLDCLLIVGATSAASTGAAWLALRRGPGALLRGKAGAWAVAGALAGVAALQISCEAHASLSHLLVFHVGGLIAVIGTALLVPPASATSGEPSL
jgi:anti-sigma factor RsiW